MALCARAALSFNLCTMLGKKLRALKLMSNNNNSLKRNRVGHHRDFEVESCKEGLILHSLALSPPVPAPCLSDTFPLGLGGQGPF